MKKVINNAGIEVTFTDGRIDLDNVEGMIGLDDLVIGARYRGEGRNFGEAIWDGVGFVGIRYKFGQIYEFVELHWDTDPHYGTFKPWEKLDE